MTTISISKSKHRLSPSLATLSLENFSQQQRSPLPSSNESTNASGIAAVSPLVQRKRHSGELPMMTSSSSSSSCNVKKTARRRARSTLGGGEDFVNGLDFAAGAPAGGASSQGSEENKPVLFFTSKGVLCSLLSFSAVFFKLSLLLLLIKKCCPESHSLYALQALLHIFFLPDVALILASPYTLKSYLFFCRSSRSP